MPWQVHAFDVALEYDRKTGDLVYDEVILTVPRQAGKSTLLLVLLVWRMTYAARRWGRQNATYLAQKGVAARKKLEREFALRLRMARRSFKEITNPKARPTRSTEWKLSMNNGSEHIMFGSQSYLAIAAPTETGSHGDTLDNPVLDEAFAHVDNRVEDAVEPAMITRRSAQLWVVSTAGNRRSVYLWRKVRAGREAVRAKQVGTVCYLEWSAPDDLDFDAPGAFESYHPAVGHTIPEARLRAKLAKARRSPAEVEEEDDDPGEDGFRRAYGNQWRSIPDLSAKRPDLAIDAAVWSEATDEESRMVGRVAFGVDVAPDARCAWIAAVGRRADGAMHLELLAGDDGADWLEAELALKVRRHRPLAVGWDAGGPTAAYSPEIERCCKADTKVVKLRGGEWSAACGAFLADLEAGRLRHLGDAWLDAAIGVAVKRRIGQSGWVWDRTDGAEISPLAAVTAALRAYDLHAARANRSVYEDDLFVA